MRDKVPFLCAALALLTAAVWAQNPESLKLVQTITVSNVNGRFDHFGMDLPGKRIFLTGEHQGTIEVIDLVKGQQVYSITGLVKPHALYYRPESNELLVSDDDGICKIYRGDSYSLSKKIKLTLEYSDGLRLDAKTGYIYVVNSGHPAKGGPPAAMLAIIDSKNWEHVGDIKFNGKEIEALAIEASGPRIFVDIETSKEVAVIDREKRTQIATWPLRGGGGAPYAVGLDEARRRLFVVTRKPGEILVMDSDSGKLITRLPVGDGADDIFYDSGRQRLYVSSGYSATHNEGRIDVYQQDDADHYRSIQTIPTGASSPTSLFAPELNEYFVVLEKNDHDSARVQVYRAQP
jgi:DNA-binding beta-propeller fold protein YncE